MGQFGLDKNNPAGGTTPTDLQRIFAAEYHNSHTNPVINGGHVTGRGDLRYNYAAGVGLVKTASGVIKVTWPAGTTGFVSKPAIDRVDIIYVDASGLVQVGNSGSVNESVVCVIDKMVLPGGASATSSSTRAHNRNYAMPYGASMGWVLAYGEFRSGDVPSSEVMHQGTFWVPTDSIIDIHVRQAVYGNLAHDGYVRYTATLDNVLLQTFEMDYRPGYVVRNWDFLAHKVSEGEHTLRINRISHTGGGPPKFFGGGTEKLSGGFVGVRHAGISE